MDQHEAELNRFLLFEHNQVNVLLPTRSTVIFEFIHDITFLWVFAAVTSMISPTAVLLNTCNHSSNSNILLSTMAVTDLLVGGLCVPLSAVVALLVSYQILTDHYICVLDFVAISSTVTLTICSIFHLTMMAWERYVTMTKILMKKLAIIACSNCNCISNTLKYFSSMMEENHWRFSSLFFQFC